MISLLNALSWKMIKNLDLLCMRPFREKIMITSQGTPRMIYSLKVIVIILTPDINHHLLICPPMRASQDFACLPYIFANQEKEALNMVQLMCFLRD